MRKLGLLWIMSVGLVSTVLAVRAHAQAITTFDVTASGASAYIINTASNPTLTLAMGKTYTFVVNAPGHPFFIKTMAGTGAPNFGTGVTNNGADSGNVVFAVPTSPTPPSPLFYQCGVHSAMVGKLIILAPIPAVPPVGVAALGLLVLGGGFLLQRRRGFGRSGRTGVSDPAA